jgi:hypothetical protein
MRTTPVAIVLGIAVFGFAGSVRAADETVAKSKIVSVSLFKNGLAIVKREATLGKPGVYVLDDVPQPVHGTYWIESTGSVESVVKMRDVEVPATETVPGNLQEDLAGKKVTIHFKGENRPPVLGTMMKFKKPKVEEGAGAGMRVEMPSRFLVLQTAKGRTYVEASEIAYFEAENPDETVIRRQPRLLLTLGDTNKEETKVAITYLTRGMAWAPSYKLDITDPKTLLLEQQAVIKNELADLDGAEVKLISGYPSVQFAHVTSPLSTRTSWAAFFQELGNSRWRNNDMLDNSFTGQGFAMNNAAFNRSPVGLSLGATPTGEGVDLHYQSIGKRTLAEGESLALTVARGKTPYERIVEWLVPDTRNEYGQEAGARGRGDEPDDGGDSAWDALKFKNPLPFAMTTGPAMVVADGKFNGQRSTYWVNAGEETVLRVEKALSIRTRALENEEVKNAGDGRDFVWIGGRHFRKSLVEGELAVSNHRNETIQLVLRRRFSGDLIDSDGNPKSSLREEGVYSVNKRNELLWTLSLKAGEERKLKYRYTVLVAN